MKFVDLQKQHLQYADKIAKRLESVLDHTQFILGPEVKSLEQQLAEYTGVKHCITTSSGTSALKLALMALDIKPGDEVITSAFSFFATAEVIVSLGAKPVFVDIELDTYNINPSLIEAAITANTKAIMPVSLYGQCVDFQSINELARRHQLPVIEDAAQSFGATADDHRSCGATTIACTSFFPTKPLGGYGDGGACFTSDDALANKILALSNHGQTKKYHHEYIGLNARLDTLQAAILLEKLAGFDQELKLRQQVADFYDTNLSGAYIKPKCYVNSRSAHAQYTLRHPERDAVIVQLAEAGVPTAIHYPKVLYHQPPLVTYAPSIACVNAELAAREVFSLPMHPYLTEAELANVVEILNALTV